MSMDANHEFEVLATVFYMTTGFMAPGKDDSRGIHDDKTRLEQWGLWRLRNLTINRAWLKVLEVQIESAE